MFVMLFNVITANELGSTVLWCTLTSNLPVMSYLNIVNRMEGDNQLVCLLSEYIGS